jgi:hypothetical protein
MFALVFLQLFEVKNTMNSKRGGKWFLKKCPDVVTLTLISDGIVRSPELSSIAITSPVYNTYMYAHWLENNA